MAIESTIQGDLHVVGDLSSSTLTIPALTLTDAGVSASAAIAASKQEHRFAITYSQAAGSDVVAATVPVYTVRGTTATLVAVQVAVTTAPTGGTEAITVDVKKGSDGSAAATMLSSVVTYDDDDADYSVSAGSIGTATLAAADTITVVVAVSGSGGAQGQGLIVTITLNEDAS